MRRQINSTLVVPSHYLVRMSLSFMIVSGICSLGGSTCTAIHISEQPPPPSKGKKKKRGPRPALSNLEIHRFLGSLPHPELGEEGE